MSPELKPEPLITIEKLKYYLGGQWVQNGLNLSVYANEIISVIGVSGSGKTTLLRSILMLQQPTSGSIHVFGTNVMDCTEKEAQLIRHRWGVMFQGGALFTSENVLENIMFPFQAFQKIPQPLRKEVALLKLKLAGLDISSAMKYPSELSGGMKKRVALARAIVLDPELVFLDEPTAGLDTRSAVAMDNLILELRNRLRITFFMITHDLDTLWHVPDRVVFLGEGRVLAALPMAELVKHDHPLIQDYFSGHRMHSPRIYGKSSRG